MMTDKGIMVRDVDQPRLSDENVLVRVVAAGICGTDLAIISGDLGVPLPLILGHEFTGYVFQVGRNVKKVDVGSRVTSEINLVCGQCFFCKANIPTQCLARKAIGIDVNGAFAEYIAVPAENIYPLPKSVSYEEGVFIEPLAAAIQTIRMSPVKPTDTVVVIGDGRLGQLVVQATKAMAPNVKLLMLGMHESKLAIAKRLATLDSTINVTNDDPKRIVMSETSGLGADIVVEATGNPDALNLALTLVRHRGTVALKSTHGQLALVDATQVAVRELTLQGSRCGPFDESIKMLKDRKVNVKPLISARYPLTKAVEAFEIAKKRETLKVVLTAAT
jgi:alcohol dehydrogenase